MGNMELGVLANAFTWTAQLWLGGFALFVAAWAAFELRNNLRHGGLNLLHAITRLPIAVAFGLLWPVVAPAVLFVLARDRFGIHPKLSSGKPPDTPP